MVLRLVHRAPDWNTALAVALARPDRLGHRERRRASDDLAWLRRAMADPGRFGLEPEHDGRVWHAPEDSDEAAALHRLLLRGVLHAGGFELVEHAGRH